MKRQVVGERCHQRDRGGNCDAPGLVAASESSVNANVSDGQPALLIAVRQRPLLAVRVLFVRCINVRWQRRNVWQHGCWFFASNTNIADCVAPLIAAGAPQCRPFTAARAGVRAQQTKTTS